MQQLLQLLCGLYGIKLNWGKICLQLVEIQKLLQYLARRLGPGLPQAALQKFIRTGQVRLDGKRCKPFDRVAEGQVVRVPPYDPDALDKLTARDVQEIESKAFGAVDKGKDSLKVKGIKFVRIA